MAISRKLKKEKRVSPRERRYKLLMEKDHKISFGDVH
jgi:hypothetical protein